MSESEQLLVAAVVEMFLDDGEDHTIKEIAAKLGWTESRVRKIISDAHGCPEGLHTREETRTSYSTNYRFMASGAHKVWVYGPSREYLRSLLNARKDAPK